MKKLIVVLAAMMVVASFGTAMAVDYARNLNDGDYKTPIVASGGSVWVLAGGTATNGATLFQINPVTGISQYWTGPFNNGSNNLGATAYTAPAMVQRGNGESGVTFVMQVVQTQDTAIGTGFTGGTSLYALYFSPTNGAGATNFVTSLAHRRGLIGGSVASGQSGFVGDEFISATSGWSTHLLIDEVNSPSGATVYGTSGVSVTAAGNGASIWSVGLYDTGRNTLNSNQWVATTQATRAVSGFYTPLAISGDSLFAIGDWTYYGNTGVSLLMFDKRKLNAGPNAAITMVSNPTVGGTTLFTTPAIAGNSIFVLDSRGGLTAYSIQPTNLLPAARVANDFTQLGLTANTAVSASPVTDGTFLAVTANHQLGAIAGITVFRIDNKRIAGTSGTSWWYEWAAGTTIAATPVISNGNVYVAVNTRNNGAAFYRFAMNKGTTVGRITAPDQTWTLDTNGVAFGFIEQGGMIIADNRLIAISNNGAAKRLYSLAIGDTANSTGYWRMFKADVTRSGSNTAAAAAPAPGDDDDSGCFISTIK